MNGDVNAYLTPFVLYNNFSPKTHLQQSLNDYSRYKQYGRFMLQCIFSFTRWRENDMKYPVILTLTLLTAINISSIHNAVAAKIQHAQPVYLPTDHPDQLVTLNPDATLTPHAPQLRAKGYVLLDVHSGRILASKHAHQRMSPASLTKMMSMYVVSRALKSGQIHLDDKVHISKKAWKTGGSRMFIKPGSSVPLKDLIRGVIVESGNDACVAIAEYVAGSEAAFVDLMNQTAAKLNMRDSHFMSSTGLPHKHHYSTAFDLAILARALQQDFPEYYSWYKQKWFTYNKIKQPNRNRLLWRDPSVDGIKTGHTQEAGFCLATSAERHNMRLVSVVMGSASDNQRFTDSQALLNYGFHFFNTHKLYAAHTPIAKARVWLAQNKRTPVGVTHDLYITHPKASHQKPKVKLILDNPLKAPIAKGQSCGTIQIYWGQQKIKTQPIIALEDNNKGGLFSNFSDRVALFLHKNFSQNKSTKQQT